jgi:hypothetical protein
MVVIIITRPITSERSMIRINPNATFLFDFSEGLSLPVRYLGMIGFNHVLSLDPCVMLV